MGMIRGNRRHEVTEETVTNGRRLMSIILRLKKYL